MASPFSVFRKNQKVMLAAITILAMFAFVFVSPWGRGSNGPRGGDSGPEVASWKFGKIYRSDINTRINNRRVVNQFIQRAYQVARDKGAFPNGGGPSGFPEDWRSALDAMILHKKAEQLGLAVTDVAINDYINRDVTENKLAGEDLDAALRAVGSGRTRYTPEQIFDALRFELEVANFRRLLDSDLVADVTPEQRYDHFSRLNRRATIQVLPIEVKDFVPKVSDPRDDELLAYFEKYKENFSSPDSPEPGFKVPVKARFQFFQAKVEDFVKEEKPKVTNDEIKKYYDEHKESFRKTDDETGTDSTDKSKPADKVATPDSTAKPDQKTDKSDKTDKEKTDKTDKTGEKKPDTAAAGKTPEPGKEPAKSGADTKPAATEKAAPEQAAPEKGAPEKKDADAKNGNPPATKPAANKPSDDKPPPAGKSVDLSPSARHHAADELLALADDSVPPPAKAADNKSPDKPAAEPAKGADPKPADNKAAESKPADGKGPVKDDKSDAKPAASPPAAPAGKADPEKPAPGKGTESASTGEKPAPGKTAEKTPAASADPIKPPLSPSGVPDLGLKPTEPPKKIPIVEYESLDSEKVREKIRTNIARDRAMTQIDKVLKDLRSDVSRFQSQHSKWTALRDGSEPQPPDFAALAKAKTKGVQFQQTGWLSARETRDTTEFGKSVVFSANGRANYVEAQAFHPQIAKFKPYESYLTEPESNFIWWRVDYKEAYVPRFEDVKKEVLAAWKFVQARKLADTQAQEYADQIKKQQAELQEVFKFKPELHPSKDIGPFTWMSRLSVARNPEQPVLPQLTSLSEIDKAGEEFMRKVFGLDVGSTGVAKNQPQTIVYVIQLKRLDPPIEQFRREFLQHMSGRFDDSQLIAYVEAQQAANAKVAAIAAEFDFKLLNADFDSGGPAGAARGPMQGDEGDD